MVSRKKNSDEITESHNAKQKQQQNNNNNVSNHIDNNRKQ